MGKVFLIDLSLCNGCHNCQLMCKDEHCNQAWEGYAAAQPNVGQFWCEVKQKDRGSVPKVMVSYIPTMCNHCEECPLIEADPNAVYRRDDGLVIIDPVKAKGNKALVDACPYGHVFWNEEEQLAQKCTGCAHLLDDGWTEPRCVDACATGCLRFGDEEDFADEIANAETLGTELDLGPKVYYLNLPKRFVAGEVYNDEADEVIIGATITLLDENGETVATTESDDFGDFWFKQVEPKVYSVNIEKSGYLSRAGIKANVREEDLNLGGIALYKTA